MLRACFVLSNIYWQAASHRKWICVHSSIWDVLWIRGCGIWQASCLSSLCLCQKTPLTILDLPSCVASQLKWRVAVQLRDYIVSKLAGYTGSWRLVRLISASLSKIFGTSITVLITPIPAKFWACVVPKRTIEYPIPNYHVVSHVCLRIFTCSVNSCMSMWEYPW